MICNKCGETIDKDNYIYCPNCGVKINSVLIELEDEAIKAAHDRNKIKKKELNELDKYWERTKYPGT